MRRTLTWMILAFPVVLGFAAIRSIPKPAPIQAPARTAAAPAGRMDPIPSDTGPDAEAVAPILVEMTADEGVTETIRTRILESPEPVTDPAVLQAAILALGQEATPEAAELLDRVTYGSLLPDAPYEVRVTARLALKNVRERASLASNGNH